MRPCPKPEQLERLLADGLDGDEEQAVTVHVQQCGSCQQILEELTTKDEGGSMKAESRTSSFTVPPSSLAPSDAFIDQLKHDLRPLTRSDSRASRPSSLAPPEPLPVIPGC